MNDVTVSFDASKFEEVMVRAANAGCAAAANVAADEAIRSFGTDHGGVPSAPGSPPNSQSGNLRNKVVFATPEALGTPLRAAFGTSVPYGRYLELGATVRAKRTKFLPVPVNDAAKRMMRSLPAGTSLRTKGLKLIVSKAKRQALLVEQTKGGKDKKNGAVFVLKRTVRILPRPWALRAAKSAAAAMEAAFVTAARDSLRASSV